VEGRWTDQARRTAPGLGFALTVLRAPCSCDLRRHSIYHVRAREEEGFLQDPPTVLPYLAYGLRGFDIDVDVGDLEKHLSGSGERVARQVLGYLKNFRSGRTLDTEKRAAKERRDEEINRAFTEDPGLTIKAAKARFRAGEHRPVRLRHMAMMQREATARWLRESPLFGVAGRTPGGAQPATRSGVGAARRTVSRHRPGWMDSRGRSGRARAGRLVASGPPARDPWGSSRGTGRPRPEEEGVLDRRPVADCRVAAASRPTYI
jgi:hypothetical protein